MKRKHHRHVTELLHITTEDLWELKMMQRALKSKNTRNIRNNAQLARRIPHTSKFFNRGYFPSRKNTSLLYFESYLELEQLISAEFEADIQYINTQPHTIEYCNNNGRLLQYTPDVMILQSNGQIKFREVKPEKYWRTNKFNQIGEKYNKLDYEFDGFTDKTYSQIRRKNLAKLFHYTSRYFENDELLFSAIDVLPRQCSIAEANALLLLNKQWPAATFYCLFLQYYVCDLEAPLTPNTIIYKNIA